MDSLRPIARLTRAARCLPTSRLLTTSSDSLNCLRRQFHNLYQKHNICATSRQLSTSRPNRQEDRMSTKQTQVPYGKSYQNGSTSFLPYDSNTSANSSANTQTSYGFQKPGDSSTTNGDLSQATASLFPRRNDLGKNVTQQVSQTLRGRDLAQTRSREEDVLLRLKPTLGRTRTVAGGDLQASIAYLEATCRRNSVKVQSRQQLIYTRRGQVRKLVKSSRWRKAFKAGFVAEVARIQKMRRQGW